MLDVATIRTELSSKLYGLEREAKLVYAEVMRPRWGGELHKYMRPDREANNVAVKCWRHKLMHTAEPRRLRETNTGVEYDWLLHWWTELPADQHYTFQLIPPNHKVLNVGLIYLITDIRRGLVQYLDDLTADQVLQHNFERIQADLGLQDFTAW